MADLAGMRGVVVVSTGTWPVSDGRVIRVDRRTERVEVEADSTAEGLLVVGDAYWPGWHAKIDGRPENILQADYLVRGVRWPPGRHVLTMTYDPPEVRWGVIVTGVSSLLAVLVGILGLWKSAKDKQVATPPKVARPVH